MTRRTMSLLDVLAPPGNDWLKEISRRRTNLPKGVHIVRFGDGDEDLAGRRDPPERRDARRRPRRRHATSTAKSRGLIVSRQSSFSMSAAMSSGFSDDA